MTSARTLNRPLADCGDTLVDLNSYRALTKCWNGVGGLSFTPSSTKGLERLERDLGTSKGSMVERGTLDPTCLI